MLFLIPPSEGKTSPPFGPFLDLEQLAFPELNVGRTKLINALSTICMKSPKKAAELLGIGPTQFDLVKFNAHLKTAPCGPAIDVYSGVLYDHLGYSTLSAAAKKRAQTSVLISSALFGFVELQNPIPAYRLSGSTVLPKVGPLSPFWRPKLTSIFDAYEGELILDMRSGSYEKLAPVSHRVNAVEVKVMTMVKGIRKSVTHFNKATKGDLVRASLSSSRKFPHDAHGLETYFRALGFNAALEESPKGARSLIILTHNQ